MQTLKERITEVMEAKQWKISAVARAADVSHSAVSQWLGRGNANTETINSTAAANLAAATGYNAVWLATGKGPKFAPDLSSIAPPSGYAINPPMPSIHKDYDLIVNAEPALLPKHARPTPVVGTAKMGDNGYYEALDYPVGQGDGWVDSYSPDPNAYALRVKGDSMHPAIRHGSFVVVEPNGRCMPGEFVAIVLIDGRKMVKEFVIEREHEIVIESVNGNQRQTLD